MSRRPRRAGLRHAAEILVSLHLLGDANKRAGIERDGDVTIGDVGHIDADGFLH